MPAYAADMSSPSTPRLRRVGAAWSLAWRLLAAAGVGAILWATVADQATLAGYTRGHPWVLIDPLLGLVAVLLLVWRRRFPLTIVLLLAAIGSVSISAIPAGAISLISLTARRDTARTAIGAAAIFVSGLVFGLVHSSPGKSSLWTDLGFNVISLAFLVAVGLYIGARRELVANLRAQVEAAAREQDLRVGRARAAERARIAREMHDVLAHRISLVSMHAGALAYRTDLSPEQVRATAQIVQQGAHQSLEELREVLGILREPERDGATPEPPQPSLGDLEPLLQEARAAGHRVDTRLEVDPDGVPTSLSRNAFRIVQEALTNARKHAPAAAVEIELTGAAGADLLITVTTTAADGAHGTGSDASVSPVPGAGLGLLGLRERADLVGGDLQAGPDRRGRFVVRARLPWPEDAESAPTAETAQESP